MPPSQEKQVVIKAINKLGRRVSAADVSTKTGLSFTHTSQIINQIAAETGGHLQVSPEGNIAYLFPIGYQTRYITRGVKHIAELCAKQVFALAFFLLRISFGAMLILSLLVIALIFLVLVFTASRDKDNEEINFDFFDWMILRELLFCNFNYDPSSYRRYDSQKTTIGRKNNFLYDCFSFLFGDGNPNINIKERRWQSIAQLIRQQHSAVTADQLSPYTGADPSNEDAVLPVLVQFDGQPAVTDSGNIVYLFPALQSTGINKLQIKSSFDFKELNWQFAKVSTGSMILIAVLAAVNFLGSWWLYLHAIGHPSLSSLMPVLLALVIYGSAFVAVPTTRYLIIQILNKRIESRNKLRHSYTSRLVNPDEKLQTKLTEAESMQLATSEIKADNLIYNTEKDALEQQILSRTN